MQLVEPSDQWRSEFLEMAAECKSLGDKRYELAISDFSAYLSKIKDGQRDIQPPGRLPGTEF